MPTIRITDNLGASLDAELAPTSSLLKYVGEVPGMILHGEDLSQLQILNLNSPAVRSLRPSLTFQKPLNLGASGARLTFGADAGGSFRVIQRTEEQTTLFDGDDYGEDLEIPAGTCFVDVGFHASVTAGIDNTAGSINFGMNATSGLAIDSYRSFPLGPGAATVTEALRQCIGGYVIPVSADDCAALPAGAVVTISGNGSLCLSATANLLAVTNPLATLTLPSPAPSLAIAQTGSVSIGASWQISGEYQVRVQKVDGGRFRLGWYRKRDSEFQVTASATAGLAAGAATGLLPTVIGAISSNAAADLKKLQDAGLSEERAEAIEGAVRAAVSRNLELAVTAEWGSLNEGEAAFLYEVDPAALNHAGTDAVASALRGDLSQLSDFRALPPGIIEIRSILTRARSTRFSLKVNLLGIFNAASVSGLALSGTVTFTPSTGELVIADTATASRIQLAAVNFGADEEKLRHVMAESFLITAAYRGSRAVLAPPQLSSAHVFFRLDNDTNRQDILRCAAIASALGLDTPRLPGQISDFGRSTVAAEVHYDDLQTRALFLKPDGTPRDRSEYESAGRRAVAMLVLPDGDDAFRLRPATDDTLWDQMKDQGPANFRLLLPAAQADGVRPDYLAIEWWADSMRSTAEILAEMNHLTGAAGAASADPNFEKLRQNLASHLRDVAAKAHEHFGAPWGLVAMFLVSGGSAKPAVKIVGPRFVYSAGRALTAAA